MSSSLTQRIARSRAWRAAFLLPVLILALHRDAGFWLDIEEFQRWAEHTRKKYPTAPRPDASLRDVYRFSDCNYPPLGALLSAGVVKVLKELGLQGGGPDKTPLYQAFRWYLCVFEVAALVLLYALARRCALRRPALAAFGLYLLPCSWAGGAIWGQIDVITQVFLLGSALALVRAILDEELELRKAAALVTLGLGSALCAMMTKQLALFAMPALLGLVATALAVLYHRHGARRCLLVALGSAAACAALFLALDRLPWRAPHGYRSLSVYAWVEGSWHRMYLFVNGPNLWTFLGKENYFPSRIPFYGRLSPLEAGPWLAMTLFLGLGVPLGLEWLRRVVRGSLPAADRLGLCLMLLGWMGLTSLLMSLTLTGTRERYFTHAFPFLFLAFHGLHTQGGALVSRGLVQGILAAGFIYGCFVYSILVPGSFRLAFVLGSQPFTAAVLLVLAAVLYVAFQRVVLGGLLPWRRPREAEPVPEAQLLPAEAAVRACPEDWQPERSEDHLDAPGL